MSCRILYLMICGAGPAAWIDVMVRLAKGRGWTVHCIATPAAVEYFLDGEALASLTGSPVRTDHQRSGQPALPKADGVIVAPATYNTINKWAAGIADTYVLTQFAELTGLGVVLPFVNTALAANRVFLRSVEELRQAGVTVLFGDGGFVPHPPRTGGSRLSAYPWELALEAVERNQGPERLPGDPRPSYW